MSTLISRTLYIEHKLRGVYSITYERGYHSMVENELIQGPDVAFRGCTFHRL